MKIIEDNHNVSDGSRALNEWGEETGRYVAIDCDSYWGIIDKKTDNIIEKSLTKTAAKKLAAKLNSTDTSFTSTKASPQRNTSGLVKDRRIVDRYMRLECHDFARAVHELDRTLLYYGLLGPSLVDNKTVFIHTFCMSRDGRVLDIKGPRSEIEMMADFPESIREIKRIDTDRFTRRTQGADLKAAMPYAKMVLAAVEQNAPRGGSRIRSCCPITR